MHLTTMADRLAVVTVEAQYDLGVASIERIAAWPLRGSAGLIEILTVRGIVTQPMLGQISATIEQIERGDGAVAIVSIFEHAVLAVTAEQMHAAEMPFVRRGEVGIPRASVVSAASLPTFRRYGWLMALEGVGRDAFTLDRLAQAFHWAQTMGDLLADERARQRIQAPGCPSAKCR